MTIFGPSINGESFFYHCEEHVDVKRFKFKKILVTFLTLLAFLFF